MQKENNILSGNFLDFDIFAVSDQNLSLKGLDQSNQFNSLVVYTPEAENETEQKFLSNILGAVKLDMSKDVFLLKTTAKQGFSFSRLKTVASFEKILLFGLEAKHLGIHLDLKPYQPMQFQSHTFLTAHPLAEIQADVNKKRALWTCLQEIYLK